MKNQKYVVEEVTNPSKCKDKVLAWITTHDEKNISWMDLRNTFFDEDIEEAIEYLKHKYINFFTSSPTLLVTKEEKELQQHSVQSEIFGKLMTLVHEFRGWTGIGEVLIEFEKIGVGMIDDAIEWYKLDNLEIEEKIKNLEALEEKNKNLKSKLRS